jgi:hypothetical protein
MDFIKKDYLKFSSSICGGENSRNDVTYVCKKFKEVSKSLRDILMI